MMQSRERTSTGGSPDNTDAWVWGRRTIVTCSMAILSAATLNGCGYGNGCNHLGERGPPIVLCVTVAKA